MRYLALKNEDKKEMLKYIGTNHIKDINPHFSENSSDDNTQSGLNEYQLENTMRKFSNKNNSTSSFCSSFLGSGCYNHHMPSVVDHITQRSEFLTCYTPYQAEVSQGTLQVIFEFQTIIAQLTQMDFANASMYDGSTALLEAVRMAINIKKKQKTAIIKNNLHPQYLETLKSSIANHCINEFDYCTDISDDYACIIVQNPNFYGQIQDIRNIKKRCDKIGAMLILSTTEILSLALLSDQKNADIVVGEAQSIGIPTNFGGPHLGFLATRKEYVRQMPGRICGKTEDSNKKDVFSLTLNTREQHIRRQKATSNICTNQGLAMLAFVTHMNLLGGSGIRDLAIENHQNAHVLHNKLSKIPHIKMHCFNFFNEFLIELPCDTHELCNQIKTKHRILPGFAIDKNKLLVAVTEINSAKEINDFANIVQKEITLLPNINNTK